MREIPGLRSELTVTFTINHSAPIGSAQEIAEAAAALLESYWLPVGSEISAEVQFAFITRPGYIAGLIGRPELAGFDSPAGAGDSVEADRG